MTNETTRPTTTAGELTPGKHIILRGTDALCHVDHVHPVHHTRQVMLLLTEVDGDDVPFTRLWRASALVTLATPEYVAEVKAAAEEVARRARLVAQLRELADDIEDHKLPLPEYRARFTLLFDDRSGVEEWAKHLGVGVEKHGQIPVAYRESKVLEVHTQSDPEPDAVALDVAAGVERAEAVQAEVDAEPADRGVVDPEPTSVTLTAPTSSRDADDSCPGCGRLHFPWCPPHNAPAGAR